MVLFFIIELKKMQNIDQLLWDKNQLLMALELRDGSINQLEDRLDNRGKLEQYLQDCISDRDNQVAALKNEIFMRDKMISSLKKEKSELTNENSKKDIDITSLKNILFKKTCSISKSNKDIITLRNELSLEKSKNKKMKESALILSAKVLQVDELKVKNKTNTNMYLEMKEVAGKLRTKSLQVKSELDELQAKYDDLKKNTIPKRMYAMRKRKRKKIN